MKHLRQQSLFFLLVTLFYGRKKLNYRDYIQHDTRNLGICKKHVASTLVLDMDCIVLGLADWEVGGTEWSDVNNKRCQPRSKSMLQFRVTCEVVEWTAINWHRTVIDRRTDTETDTDRETDEQADNPGGLVPFSMLDHTPCDGAVDLWLQFWLAFSTWLAVYSPSILIIGA